MESALAAGMFRYLRQQEPLPRLLSPSGYESSEFDSDDELDDDDEFDDDDDSSPHLVTASAHRNNKAYQCLLQKMVPGTEPPTKPDSALVTASAHRTPPDSVNNNSSGKLMQMMGTARKQLEPPKLKPPKKPEQPKPTPPKMSAEIYRCLLAGDLDPTKLQNPVSQSQDEESRLEKVSPSFDGVTPLHNTALHIVARQGFDELIRVILNRGPPDLLTKQNKKGELALHLAAGAGHLAAVDAIMEFVQEQDRESVCEKKNKYGETPLHVAVRNKHISVARSLVKYHPKSSFCLDKTGDSPLYLAAESGELELVKDMIEENPIHEVTEDVQNALKRGEMKSVVHSAILGGNSGVLEEILKEYKFMIKSKARITNEGVICPLACAGFIGNVKIVKYILENFPDDCRAYRMERSGFYPIHIAAGAGHKLVIEEFLRFGPDLRELLTRNGQNILHVSASRGKYDVVNYILNQPDFDDLINARDNKGNTPLHLAAAAGYPKVVDALTWDNRVRLDLENGDHKSAMDLALTFENQYPYFNKMYLSFNKQLTWLALIYAGGAPKQKAAVDTNTATATYKDRVNALSVVAALVITVTFTAGFVIPGGNNGSDPDLGMTSFPKRIVFRVYVISNSIALYMSILDLLVLIFAMLGDVKLAQVSLNSTLILLTTSLVAMSISFISAVYLVVSSIWWLGIFVWVMGSAFIAVLLLLFFLLSPPMMILPTNQFTRYLAYPAFKAMVYICEF